MLVVKKEPTGEMALSRPEEVRRCLPGDELDKSTSGAWNFWEEGFPGGAVFKNPPANAGDVGLSPGLGRSHMPQSN